MTEQYTHVAPAPPAPVDDLWQLRVNGSSIPLSRPLKDKDGVLYLAIQGDIFPQMGLDYLWGLRSKYMWFGNGGTRTVGLHKTGLGFALLDLAPTEPRLRAFKEGEAYYVEMHRFLFLLGALTTEKKNGVWEITFIETDPNDAPWVTSCNRHGYIGTDQLLKCPMNQFLMIPHYTKIMRGVGDPLDGKGPMGILKAADRKVMRGGYEPGDAKGVEWRKPKGDIEWLNTDAAKWQKANYDHWRYLRSHTADAADMTIDAVMLLMMADYGIQAFNWYTNPARNIALVDKIQDETLAAMGKREEALEAAGRQRLGYGYPLIFPTKENPNAPGRGTFAVVRAYNKGFFPQASITGVRPPQVIQGVASASGRTTFLVTIERGAYLGSPLIDGVGPIKDQYWAIEVKDGYGGMVANATRGEFEEWFERSGGVDSLLNELQSHVSASAEMGWRLRWVFTDPKFAVAMRVRATQHFGAEFMKQVEFKYVFSQRAMIPPPPLPGLDPFPPLPGPIRPKALDTPNLFDVPLTEEAIPQEYLTPVPADS